MLKPLLLIIDPQNDFCDLPADAGYTPRLPVTGAHEDCLRLADLIGQGGAAIARIIVTLDSHHPIDLAHHTVWRDGENQIVPAFTEIRASDVRASRYRFTAHASDADEAYVLAYLEQLEALGRTLVLWPPHCEIGTLGHNVHSGLMAALRQWEYQQSQTVGYVHKGENRWTESFSALQAVIPYQDDPATALNQALLAELAAAEQVWVAGQASSHCVKETLQDMVKYAPDLRGKLTVLTDCMSPVSGYEQAAADFLQSLPAQGVCLATSVDVLSWLRGQ